MTAKEERTRRLCAAKNIRIIQQGQAFRLLGPGVDITAASLANISEHDLEQAIDDSRSRWMASKNAGIP